MIHLLTYKDSTLEVEGVGDLDLSQWEGSFIGKVKDAVGNDFQMLVDNSNYETFEGSISSLGYHFEAIFALSRNPTNIVTGEREPSLGLSGRIIDERFKSL